MAAALGGALGSQTLGRSRELAGGFLPVVLLWQGRQGEAGSPDWLSRPHAAPAKSPSEQDWEGSLLTLVSSVY